MTKKNILYVNYILQYGHVNFDRIHIYALKSTGNNVKLILHYKIAKELEFSLTEYELILPKFLGIDSHNPVLNRIFYILTLLYIKVRVSFKSYDRVILSSMDEPTLGLIPLCRKMFLICHANASNFENTIKRFFMKKLAKYNYFIVFNRRMKESFIANRISNVFVVSHGCIAPYMPQAHLTCPIDTTKYDFVIFHPSAKIENFFLEELKSNKKLQRFLKENNYAFVIRDKSLEIEDCENIIIIHKYLTKEQYQTLFVASDVILLVYPESFRYQVSGISYECVSNKKRILIRNNPSLEYCGDFYNYDPFFLTTEQLCKKIEFLRHNLNAECIVSASTLQPDYREIMNLDY